MPVCVSRRQAVDLASGFSLDGIASRIEVRHRGDRADEQHQDVDLQDISPQLPGCGSRPACNRRDGLMKGNLRHGGRRPKTSQDMELRCRPGLAIALN